MYIKEKLVPGYTGSFVIQHHLASHDHFDLRLEFPVNSVSKALADYSGKRPKKGVEPTPATPDKPGNVLRSWAIPKHKIPGHKPILATETENHAIQYLNFKGVIPSGYGAGTVEIYDHGTYTLNSVDYDKKYVFTLHGKKIKGTFALVKTGGKSFLWVKTKEDRKACVSAAVRKTASAIDYVKPTLCHQLFDLSKNPPVMLDKIRKLLVGTYINAFKAKGIADIMTWTKGLYLSGSLTSYNYAKDADIDVDIIYDPNLFKAANPKTAKLSDRELFEFIKKIIYEKNDAKVDDTPHTFSYMLLEPGDRPVSDGVYDILANGWVKGPIKIPEDFNPDKAFIKERKIAESVSQIVDLIIGKIVRITEDLEVEGPPERHEKLIRRLKYLCKALNSWYDWIWDLQKDAKNATHPVYPAFNFSPNWDRKMIIFKYLARHGYQQCIVRLYKLLKNSLYLGLIDSFIPD